ncbi:glyoxalase [Virgibacillus profundi]|uniref:Glyoxalase n=1 Tax=Virgibacillus profundi TaxID=2024555 RepID=A0A2A2IEJ8_9BACI|nr:VOC family protein [Virgibacillus profundi]PAV29736.1 glyoxalase [Virgibacillus profundi]PXY53908.1 glyoxalase [Virgibacillus profundi]
MSFHYELIDHVQLAAPKNGEDQARKFYDALLGFKEIEKPDSLRKNGGVWFQAGSVHIHIGIEDPFCPAKKAHPAIRVKNIEAMKKYLKEKNVDFSIDELLPCANRFYVSDPFGNRIEFLEWM